MENSVEIWQTQVNGQIYEANFDELTQWIVEGALLPQDKVRRGNLRWIEASKIPVLQPFFNSTLNGYNQPSVTTTYGQNQTNFASPLAQNQQVFQPMANFDAPPPPNLYQELNPETEQHFCLVHQDAKARYHCETCANYFCKACPNQGICPMCGATCTMLQISYNPPPVHTKPLTQNGQQSEITYNEGISKAANWMMWKAALTVINGIILLTGGLWYLVLGTGMPHFIHGLLLGMSGKGDNITEASISQSPYFGASVLMMFGFAFVFGMLGLIAKNGSRGALVFGIIIFAADGLLCLFLPSFLGIIVHLIALFQMGKAVWESE